MLLDFDCHSFVRIMSLSLWLRPCNTVLWLIKHPMPSIGLQTQGNRSNHMFSMVCEVTFLLCSATEMLHACNYCMDQFTCLIHCFLLWIFLLFVVLCYSMIDKCVACFFKSCLYFISSVIRASVPKLELDAVFEQKNDIAKAVEEELDKVFILVYNLDLFCFLFLNIDITPIDQ